jgi:hypothetical protein
MATLKKTFAPVLMVLISISVTSLLIVSCNQKGDGTCEGTCVPATKDTSALGKIDHFIPKETINEYKRSFSIERDSLALKAPGLFIPETEAFNKPSVLEILKNPACVGVRIYYGVKKGEKRNQVRLILVGVDAQGKDLFITKGSALAAQAAGDKEGGLEYGQCPPCQIQE